MSSFFSALKADPALQATFRDAVAAITELREAGVEFGVTPTHELTKLDKARVSSVIYAVLEGKTIKTGNTDHNDYIQNVIRDAKIETAQIKRLEPTCW